MDFFEWFLPSAFVIMIGVIFYRWSTRKRVNEMPGMETYAAIEVKCHHCGGTKFKKEDRLLNTAGATILGLDWADAEAVTLTCTECSHIMWFRNDPE